MFHLFTVIPNNQLRLLRTRMVLANVIHYPLITLPHIALSWDFQQAY